MPNYVLEDPFYDEDVPAASTRRNLSHWSQEGKLYFVKWHSKAVQGDFTSRSCSTSAKLNHFAWYLLIKRICKSLINSDLLRNDEIR